MNLSLKINSDRRRALLGKKENSHLEEPGALGILLYSLDNGKLNKGFCLEIDLYLVKMVMYIYIHLLHIHCYT